MQGNEYQKLAMRTNDNKSSKEIMSFSDFCEALKECGAYQADDGHIYNANGKIMSRQGRNGYYTLRKMFNNHTYYFMEHRVVYYFAYGKFDEKLQINHKDFNRANNHIDNLELVTCKENIRYTINAKRARYIKGCECKNAAFTEKEVQLIRYLKKNGWKSKEINELFGNKTAEATINRVVEKARYGNVLDASGVTAIYPLIVEKTRRKDLSKDEALKNATIGLSGECGEVTDIMKKFFYQDNELDLIHLMLELGDIVYYLYWIGMLLDIDMTEVYFANIEKLNKRYPDGFDSYRANHRQAGDI